VKNVSSVKAHYVGNYVHVELKVTVDEKKSLKEAHDISEKIEKKVEQLKVIDKAFVHVDPV